MALFRPANFGTVALGKLYKVEGQHITWTPLSQRHKVYPFLDSMGDSGDYDILGHSFDQSFFSLPSIYYRVKPEEKARPDLVSYRVYQETDYWSFILIFNHIADPFDGFEPGDILNIPIKQNLMRWLTINILQKGKN